MSLLYGLFLLCDVPPLCPVVDVPSSRCFPCWSEDIEEILDMYPFLIKIFLLADSPVLRVAADTSASRRSLSRVTIEVLLLTYSFHNKNVLTSLNVHPI